MLRPEGDVTFLWDDRPGKNIEHILRHGLTPKLWEQVFFAATRRQADADDATIEVAEGRVVGCLYRIVYEVLGSLRVRPIEIFPITGFPVRRRDLER
jgi:hypothetical protein